METITLNTCNTKVNNSVEFLDCTLRDGGYHNNWNFSNKLINEYLRVISSTNIKHVELGFRMLNKKQTRGNTAYTTDAFISSLKIPNNLNVGVMVNAGDFLQSNLSEMKACRELFPETKNTKLKFVRLACHIDEPFKIINVIKWLKRNNFMVTINLMQISEIHENQIKKLCKFLKNLKIDVLYLADSFGSLKPKDICKITNSFKKFWSGDLGIHAHNNMKLALSNSLEANRNGVKWIDSTVLGMGRGPGNVKTEDLVKYFLRKHGQEIKINLLENLIKKYFLPLKKKYKWGSNKYYNLAGRNKIHPTYIQEMLSDKRYNKLNYLKILNNLKRSDARKYDIFKLLESKNIFLRKPRGLWSPISLLNNKNVLIVAPGDSVLKYRKLLEKFILKNNVYVICLNTASTISSSLINLRVACNPHRIRSDTFFHSNSKKDLAIPVSTMPKKVYDLIKVKNKKIFNYGLSIQPKYSIVIKNNYCVLPKPLATAYALAIAIAGKVNQVFLAGFDGHKIDDPTNDETNQIFKILKKKYNKKFLISLTPTKYNIEYKSVSSLKL